LAKSPEAPIHLPTSLALAEKWAKEMGRKTQRILSDPSSDGTRVPLLMITHGIVPVCVGEDKTCVNVYIQVKLPTEVRAKLATLAPEDKQRLLITFIGELSSNSRAGFSFIPQNLTSVEQLEIFTVAEVLKISEDDISSFNRFCDALQETVTTASKATRVFGLLMSTQTPSTTAVKPASGALYG
jgi:hypothetical protein